LPYGCRPQFIPHTDQKRRLNDRLIKPSLSAERSSVWTLIHPELSVAIPQPDVLAAPVSIALSRDAESLAEFINVRLRLKREDQTINQLYKYWILGGGAEPLQPCWSVIRDVLAWVD
jgi:hypothetical protein